MLRRCRHVLLLKFPSSRCLQFASTRIDSPRIPTRTSTHCTILNHQKAKSCSRLNPRLLFPRNRSPRQLIGRRLSWRTMRWNSRSLRPSCGFPNQKRLLVSQVRRHSSDGCLAFDQSKRMRQKLDSRFVPRCVQNRNEIRSRALRTFDARKAAC